MNDLMRDLTDCYVLDCTAQDQTGCVNDVFAQRRDRVNVT
jgi:hypothetical protein